MLRRRKIVTLRSLHPMQYSPYLRVVSVVLLFNASANAVAPSAAMLLCERLRQKRDEEEVQSHITLPPPRAILPLLESCQRAVALQRLGQRLGALSTNLVLEKTKIKTSMMRRRNTANITPLSPLQYSRYLRVVSVLLLFNALANALAPSAPIVHWERLRQKGACCGEGK